MKTSNKKNGALKTIKANSGQISNAYKIESVKSALLKTLNEQTETGNLDEDIAKDLEFVIVDFLDKISVKDSFIFDPRSLSLDDDDDFAPYNDLT